VIDDAPFVHVVEEPVDVKSRRRASSTSVPKTFVVPDEQVGGQI